MTRPVLRFAPSPNGRLHLGHAYSALLNARIAEQLGGVLLLRIENIDPVRSRPDFEAAILEDLAWLGLAFPNPIRRQSQHLDAYRARAEELRARGLLYPCRCSRGEIADAVARQEARTGRPWPRDPDGAPLYPGTCRLGDARPGSGERPTAWRLDMAAAARLVHGPLRWTSFAENAGACERAAAPQRWGDPVLVRKDVPTSYHLAVVTDDAEQGVTHVVRGADLELATDLHCLLQALLGLPSPRYHHHLLIRDETGLKLAKSAGAPPLSRLRAAGVSPSALRESLRV